MFSLEIKDNFLSIGGLTSAGEMSDKTICVKLTDRTLLISGSGLTVTKLDVDDGILVATGKINNLRFGGKDSASGLFKKLTK